MIDDLPHPVSMTAIEEKLREAAKHYKELHRLYYLSYVHIRHKSTMEEPDWEIGKCVDACVRCGSYNFCPIVHPRSLHTGFGCCDCGASFRYGYGRIKQYSKEETNALVSRLKYMGFTDKQAMGLIGKYGMHTLEGCFGRPPDCYA